MVVSQAYLCSRRQCSMYREPPSPLSLMRTRVWDVHCVDLLCLFSPPLIHINSLPGKENHITIITNFSLVTVLIKEYTALTQMLWVFACRIAV